MLEKLIAIWAFVTIVNLLPSEIAWPPVKWAIDVFGLILILLVMFGPVVVGVK